MRTADDSLGLGAGPAIRGVMRGLRIGIDGIGMGKFMRAGSRSTSWKCLGIRFLTSRSACMLSMIITAKTMKENGSPGRNECRVKGV